MKLQTQIPFTEGGSQINYQSQLLILGSCFAQNMGKKLEYFKFQTLQNPFGILFHPLAIEKLIAKATAGETYAEKDVFFLNERWHCFDAHSDLSDRSKEGLLEKLNLGLQHTKQQIAKASHLIITLGTAWVYRKTDTNTLVANCHKLPQKEFTKELLSVDEIKNSIEATIKRVKALNNRVQFVFTVSPVRHLKDGFVENQRSKAHLIAAVHYAINALSQRECWREAYFPSYELQMDELRDYRFYASDMMHPNQLAIDYIWEKFVSVWIASTAQHTMEKVDAIQKGMQHRPFHPESEQHQTFMESLEKKITYLQKEHPHMKF